jgi:integrase
MPRVEGSGKGPRIILFGPDSKHGATPKPGYKTYVWFIVWSERGRTKLRSCGTGDRAEAQRALADFLDAQKKQQAISDAVEAANGDRPRKPDEMFVADALALYQLGHGSEVKDPQRMAYAIEPLIAHFGSLRVSDVTASRCREYAKLRKQQIAAKKHMKHEEALHRKAERSPTRRAKLTQQRVAISKATKSLIEKRRADGWTWAAIADEFNATGISTISGSGRWWKHMVQKIYYERDCGAGGSTESSSRQKSSRTQSDSTARRELGTLRAALRWCKTEGKLTAVPDVVQPPPGPAREDYLTRSEFARLLLGARKGPRANRHLPLFLLLGAYTGRRKETIFSLKFKPHSEGGYVDLDRGIIDFRKSRKEEVDKRRGIIPIPERLMPHLRAAKRRNKEWVIEYEGKPIADIDNALAAAAKRGGLEKHLHPHILRHTAASWLVQKGTLRYEDISDYLSMTIEVLKRVYGHLDPRGAHARVLDAWRQK